MNRTTFEQQRAFAGERKPSMKRRALDHDYHERRIYLITLVVEGRRPLLGRVVGDVGAERGSAAFPRVEPSALGAAVARVWASIPAHHPGVEVLAFQLMPDHLHGILFVTRQIEEGLGRVILGFKQACNKEYRRLFGVGYVAVAQQHTQQVTPQTQAGPHPAPPTPHPAPPTPHPTPPASRGLLFERGYNDRILLRAGQLEVMRRYLADNPFRLAMKRARPELLRVRQGVRVCGRVCSAVGNMALLGAERRLRVRISRSIDAALLEAERERLLEAARAGAVLVSPAISPGEKAVTRAAFDEGLPMIVLLDNGLDPLSKPSGERFRACAEGRLLLLSPFPHRGCRVAITRAVCEALNALAWDICEK